MRTVNGSLWSSQAAFFLYTSIWLFTLVWRGMCLDLQKGSSKQGNPQNPYNDADEVGDADQGKARQQLYEKRLLNKPGTKEVPIIKH